MSTIDDELDNVLNQLIDYVAIGKGDMHRMKARKELQQLIARARVEEMKSIDKHLWGKTTHATVTKYIHNRIVELQSNLTDKKQK